MNNYHLQFIEYNGEHEYTHDFLFAAIDGEYADEVSDNFLRRWYASPDTCFVRGNDYEFFGGTIVLRLHFVHPTTEQEFAKFIVDKYTL